MQAKLVDAIRPGDWNFAIIDGEIVALTEKGGPSFQALQGVDMGKERPPIGFFWGSGRQGCERSGSGEGQVRK